MFVKYQAQRRRNSAVTAAVSVTVMTLLPLPRLEFHSDWNFPEDQMPLTPSALIVLTVKGYFSS